jgi:hypothetical protein
VLVGRIYGVCYCFLASCSSFRSGDKEPPHGCRRRQEGVPPMGRAYSCLWIKDLQSLSLVVAQVENVVFALVLDVGWAGSWTMSLLFVLLCCWCCFLLSSSVMYFYNPSRVTLCNRCFAPSIIGFPKCVENIFKWILGVDLKKIVLLSYI